MKPKPVRALKQRNMRGCLFGEKRGNEAKARKGTETSFFTCGCKERAFTHVEMKPKPVRALKPRFQELPVMIQDLIPHLVEMKPKPVRALKRYSLGSSTTGGWGSSWK